MIADKFDSATILDLIYYAFIVINFLILHLLYNLKTTWLAHDVFSVRIAQW